MFSSKLNKTLGAAACFLMGAASTADASIIGQPCETCGLAFAPLPEGIFFLDNESYGQRDGQGNRLGVNEPTFIWSTPFTIMDSRLEVVLPDPIFTHIDGSSLNRVDLYTTAAFLILAHDFHNGFNAAIMAGTNTDDQFTNAGRDEAAQLRFSVSYVKDGWNATATLNYFGNFGGKYNGILNGVPQGFDDNIFLDYTLTHKFGKLELGVVGTAVTDIGGPIPTHPASIAVGGLIGYDFGKVSIQAFATREVAVRDGGWGLGPNYGNLSAGPNGGPETRGTVRVIFPIWLAPSAAPVVAKY